MCYLYLLRVKYSLLLQVCCSLSFFEFIDNRSHPYLGFKCNLPEQDDLIVFPSDISGESIISVEDVLKDALEIHDKGLIGAETTAAPLRYVFRKKLESKLPLLYLLSLIFLLVQKSLIVERCFWLGFDVCFQSVRLICSILGAFEFFSLIFMTSTGFF